MIVCTINRSVRSCIGIRGGRCSFYRLLGDRFKAAVQAIVGWLSVGNVVWDDVVEGYNVMGTRFYDGTNEKIGLIVPAFISFVCSLAECSPYFGQHIEHNSPTIHKTQNQ